MKYTRDGFTVIELLVVIVLLGIGSWLFFTERAHSVATERDNQRKISINAMYYNLEEYYYPKYNSYPEKIDSKVLRAMNPDLFTDPNGFKIGDSYSDYTYTPTGCNTEGICTGYKLRSSMQQEDDFIKTNRNN